MAEYLFYHQTRTPFEVTVPALCGKALERGWRCVIRAPDAGLAKWLDDRLWMGEGEAFLPHGPAGGPHDADQPILLTTGPGAANAAQMLMTVGGAALDEGDAAFERVCVVFDGNDEAAVQVARDQWKQVTGAGQAAQYWSQESGRWECRTRREAT